MKKIFSAVILVLSLASCIKEVFEVPGDQNIDVTGTVTLNFGVTIPDAQTVSTKSISAQEIKSMTVIVFDERGYLVEAKDVDLTDYNVLDKNNTRQEFGVRLHQSVSPRTLHFVANSPVAADDISFGTEAEIMTSLVTSPSEVDGNVVYPDAYWQMVKVNRLLEQEKNTLCDEGGLLYSIPLIRNFAKITVVENLENFTLTGFELINIPKRGTVAPYNPSSGLGSFQQYFNPENKKGLNYIDLYQNYTGFMPMDFNPSTDLLPNIPENNHTWNTNSKYTYERTYGDNPTAVLIKGKYGNGSETYYKAEIFGFINGQPHNYNILRNIEYTITITNVLGDGYGNAGAAAGGVAGNNISYSAETQNYSNISDGNCRLFVEYISKRVVSNDQFTIKYKFVPDISFPNTVSNGVGGTNPIQISLAPKTEDDALTDADETGIPVIKRVGETAQWEVRKSNGAIYVDGEGWSYIDITPNPVTLGQDTVLEEDMTFTATTEIDGQTYVLSRTVKLSKRNPYPIVVSCPKDVSRQLGAEVLVETYIPTGLDEFMFPLVFSIEASALTLYPNSDAGIVMPVVSGQSIITTQPKNTFHYERTLTYAEYEELVTRQIDLDGDGEGTNPPESMKLVPSYFKTNKAQSDTQVYVYNEYFGLANDSVVTATN